MSPRRFYDRYMVHEGAARHLKFRDFSPAEKCAHFLGVLSIASQAPVRGTFTVGERPATADDVAWEAGVPVASARKALSKLRELGVLYADDDLGRERVHDWDDVNPPPKHKPSDETERTAQRKRAQRERDRGVSRPPVTPLSRPGHAPVTPPEVEEEKEGELPPLPPEGDQALTPVRRAQANGFDEWLADHAAVTGDTPPKTTSKHYAHLAEMFNGRRDDGLSLDDLKLASRGAFGDEYRRSHGHIGAESVLRPLKCLELVNKGKRAVAKTGEGSSEDQLARRRATQKRLEAREAEMRARAEANGSS